LPKRYLSIHKGEAGGVLLVIYSSSGFSGAGVAPSSRSKNGSCLWSRDSVTGSGGAKEVVSEFGWVGAPVHRRYAFRRITQNIRGAGFVSFLTLKPRICVLSWFQKLAPPERPSLFPGLRLRSMSNPCAQPVSYRGILTFSRSAVACIW
jgi:hypothetical protein